LTTAHFSSAQTDAALPPESANLKESKVGQT